MGEEEIIAKRPRNFRLPQRRGFGPLVSPPMAISAKRGTGLDGLARVTLEAAVPAAACEGEAWAEMASAWTLEAVRAALRSVA